MSDIVYNPVVGINLPVILTQEDLLRQVMDTFNKIMDITDETPNDQELGEKLRELMKPYIIMKRIVEKQIQNGQ